MFKYLFMFFYFTGNTIISIKETVTYKADCEIIAAGLYETFEPHLMARGYTKQQANKILQDQTKCLQLTSANTAKDNDHADGTQK